MKPLVSVIIPTRNSNNRVFLKCLESVRNQDYKNVELIVVDNCSDDDTKKVALKYTKKVYNFGPERTAQKNFAIKNSNGKYILSVDSDQELPINMISKAVDEAEKGFDAILMEDNGIGTTFWSKAHAFEKTIHFKDTNVTAPRFFNREKIISIGGFDERLVLNEDLELHERMKKNNFKIGHIDILFNHYEGGNLSEVIKKSFYYGTTAGNYFSKSKSKGIKLYLLYHPMVYLKNWKYFLKHPVYGIASIIRKIFTYIGGIMGLFYNFFNRNIKFRILKNILNKKVAYMILFITSRCNSKCKYCFYWKEINKNKKELTTGEYEKLSKKMKGLLYLNLTGGEPFLREDIDQIVFNFYKNSEILFLAISTNGTLPEVVKQKIEKISSLCPNLKINLSVSIDAIGKKHDEIRGHKNNFEKCMKTIEYIKKMNNPNIRLIVQTVYSLHNRDDILELNKFLKEKGIDQHRIGIVRIDTRKEELNGISLEHYNEILKKINNPKKSIFSVINSFNHDINIKTRKNKKRFLPCVAGRKMIVIAEEGDVYPCEILNKSFGNLRNFDYSVYEILKKNKKTINNLKKYCFCDWGCATQNNIIFNIKTYPKILWKLIRK